ncbi:hypothetical protein Tco_1173503 [Tanacetum coccineum]
MVLQLTDFTSEITDEELLEFTSEYYIPFALHPAVPAAGASIADFQCPVSASSLSEESSEDELTLLRRLRRLSLESELGGLSLGECLCPSLLWTSRLPSLSRTLMRRECPSSAS